MKIIDEIKGFPVSKGYAEGEAKIITNPLQEFDKDILVVKETNPDYTPHMYSSKGIVGEVGGMLTHLAIVSREAQIPAISAVEKATERIIDGDYVRMNAESGRIIVEKRPYVRLEEQGANSAFRFGGKSKGLNMLINNGFLVPQGYAIDFQFAYNLNSDNLEKLIKSLSLDSDKKYAVRSSAVSEDSDKKSFAGQYSTRLSVPYEFLADNIRDVMTEKTARNEVYSNGLIDTKVGCIVQEYVDADISGVIFTKNPITDNPDEIIIEVLRGAGENLVSGKVNPTTYIVEKSKGYKLFNEHILTNELLEELNESSARIKYALGKDADIEFCIKDRKIYYLQARPITT